MSNKDFESCVKNAAKDYVGMIPLDEALLPK